MSAPEIQERVDHELDIAEFVRFDRTSFREQINRIIPNVLSRLDSLLIRHAYFHCIFLLLGTLEFFCVIAFFTLLAQSSTLAIALGLLFLTLFSYLMLRLYLQSQKAEQLIEIRNFFIDETRKVLGYQEGIAEHHMALANACCKMSTALYSREYCYWQPPQWADFLTTSLENFSCWCLWQDIHTMRETFMLASVEEHIKLVKCEPTNLEVHAALANAYVMLSSVYAKPDKEEGYDDERWIPQQRYSEEMQNHFRATAQRAIQEFTILNSYAPNDPWVHAQLAYSYHDLQMPEEEIKQYETILQLRPADKETLFKLGVLYFQQGRNADGLKIYEKLKLANYHKADNLIAFYGSY